MQAGQILDEARSHHEWIRAIRRELHQYPELGYEEVRTSQLIRKHLDDLNIPYRYPVAETGIVASLGTGDGPCVALRADMDALPIFEESGVPFCSLTPGTMHACGHDCHVSMLLGAARLLKEHESELPGTVKLLFQPAEEGGAGGQRMCDEGALEDPIVSRIFGLHVWPFLQTGHIASRAGAFLASAGAIEIHIHGRGGHAAMPHVAIDPVMTAAKVVCELQTIVSRELDPLVPGVISITSINGGTAHNVIPPSVRLIGTVRSLSKDGMTWMKERIREITIQIAAANRCEATVEFPNFTYPPVVNDGAMWQVVQQLGGELLGQDKIHESPPVMGGEDFSYYTERIPGCFVVLGIGNEEEGAVHGLHTPRFRVDENALPLGTALHTAFAIRSLAELR